VVLKGSIYFKGKEQDWKFFHSLSREKKMSKLSKRLFLLFLICNSWQAGTEYHVPREGTECATGRHKMCHGKAQNVSQHGTKRLLNLCAMGRHKMCHFTAQNVPFHGTKCAIAPHKKTFRLLCHRTAQKVPQDGTKCATARHKRLLD
jgi:hypothetical protein